MNGQRSLAKVLMLLAGLPGCGVSTRLGLIHTGTKVRHPSVPAVDVAEARGLRDAGAIFVDVRSPEERSVSRIPGAIDREQVEENPEDFQDKVLVAYCTVGVRSANWAAQRRREGLDVRNMKGSALAWAWAGLPFEGPNGETHELHTWSDQFAWLPEGYEVVNKPPAP